MKYKIIPLPKREDSDRQVYMLSVRRPLSKDTSTSAKTFSLTKFVDENDGIDNFEPIGRYTINFVIAEVFDQEEVLEKIKGYLETELSEIALA